MTTVGTWPQITLIVLGASRAVTALGRALAAAERRGWIRLRVGSPAS
jgi:hypothetical protein